MNNPGDELQFPPLPRAACPHCGTSGTLLHRKLRDPLYGAAGEWDIRRCPDPACGLFWQDPMPDRRDLARAYANYYTHEPTATAATIKPSIPAGRLGREYLARYFGYPLAGGMPRSLNLSPLLALLPRMRTRLDDTVGHLPYEPGGRLLEIGCGDGAFLRTMRELGWTVTGTETDSRSSAIARSGGLDVRQGELGDLELPAGHYSAIVMRHVIEHVMEPAQVLAQCCILLRPGGVLVLTTPNPASLGHRLFRSAWRGLEPPRHLHLFSQPSIGQYLQHAGFTNVTSRSTLHWADGILRQSALIRFPVLRRSLLGKIVAGLIGGAIAQVEIALNGPSRPHGEELLILARRPS